MIDKLLERYFEIDDVEGIVLNKRGIRLGLIIAFILINIVGYIEYSDIGPFQGPFASFFN